MGGRRRQAAGALGSLAFNHANKEAICEAGGIPPLIALLKSGPSKPVTLNAAVALSNLVVNPANQVGKHLNTTRPLLPASPPTKPHRQTHARVHARMAAHRRA